MASRQPSHHFPPPIHSEIRLLGQESFRRHRKIGLAPAQEHLDIRWLIRVGDLEEFALWAKEFFDRPRGSTRLHRAADSSAATVDIRVLTAWTAMSVHSWRYRCDMRIAQARQMRHPPSPSPQPTVCRIGEELREGGRSHLRPHRHQPAQGRPPGE